MALAPDAYVRKGAKLMKPVYLASVILFTLVAIAHLWRLLTGAEVVIDGYVVPQWISIFGVLVPGTLALIIWRTR